MRTPTFVTSLAFAVAAVALAVAPTGAAASIDTVALSWCCPMNEVEAAHGLIVLETDNSAGRIVRVDPATGETVASLDLAAPPNGNGYFDVPDVAVADGSVWVALYWQNVVERLQPV